MRSSGVSKECDRCRNKKSIPSAGKKVPSDTNPGDKEAEVKFKEASEAYKILTDPEKSSQYDQFGHAAFEQGGAMVAVDLADLISRGDMGDIFGDIFGDLFGGGRSR